MPDRPVIAPRRVVASTQLVLLTEIRPAWRVPSAAPFKVNSDPDYLIIGLIHAAVTTDYESELYPSSDTAERMYDVARDSAESMIESPVFRWISMETPDQPLHPEIISFDYKQAVIRARANEDAAKPKEEPRRAGT